MQTTIHRLLFVVVISVFVSSCATEHLTDSPYEPLTNDAIRRFAELRDAGKLPGLRRDEHGRLESEPIPQRDRVVYPVSVVLHVSKEVDRSRYSYTFTKDTRFTEWRLTKAARVFPDDQREDLKLE